MTLPYHANSIFFFIKLHNSSFGQLQKDADKELIITVQAYDGTSSMHFQAQGHVHSRLSVWDTYMYCR